MEGDDEFDLSDGDLVEAFECFDDQQSNTSLFNIYSSSNATFQNDNIFKNSTLKKISDKDKQDTSTHDKNDSVVTILEKNGKKEVFSTINSEGFDTEAGEKWIYPINLPIRSYQINIVQKALFNNTLVCLPTGLGKTFIAAVVMYNFYRWYPFCKVVFMAPTKPLVMQQVKACQEIMGVSSDHVAEMTGMISQEKRKVLWRDKRVFFITPHVLLNDLQLTTCSAHQIKCLVLDEAHKATGSYPYCLVVRELRRMGCVFRVVALSATPGSDFKAVQKVIENLMINHVEIRTDDCVDVQAYTHHRSVQSIVVPLSDEIITCKNMFLRVIEIFINRLRRTGVLYKKNLDDYSIFLLFKARENYRKSNIAKKQSVGALLLVFCCRK